MSDPVMVWEGAEALRPLLRPLAEFHPHPSNPRIGDIDEIAASLSRFGQVRAILANANGDILAGNHTWKAANQLGWTHAAFVVEEFATPEDARDYLLADNRLGDLGEYDQAELRLLVEELEKAGRWDGTGYVPDDLAMMRELEQRADRSPEPPEPPPAVEPAAPSEFREVVLMFGEGEGDLLAEFGGHVGILRGEYGTEGVSETVARAVHEAALRVNQGAEA